MSWTLSCVPAASPLEARMAAESTREFPVTNMDSGVEQAPGALSWACKSVALAAVNASATDTIFILEIYTSRFGGGPRRGTIPIRQRGRWRVALQRPR